jgi:NAD(P)-dependent dehydrogenase (short-subunit alcohol dehydrogenase family)
MMNKVAIITGASQGIGAGLVAAYRKLGYSVVGTSRSIGDSHDSLAALHPLGRLGEISDVVDAIVYLENAAFVTGEIRHVDGGQSAGH